MDVLGVLASSGKENERRLPIHPDHFARIDRERDAIDRYLTAFMAGVARSVAGSNVTINFLLPGTFDTDRLQSNIVANAKNRGISVDQAKAERMATVPAKRFGTPDEFGAACAFLCSAQAGYITGQNLLIDGGAFPGAM